MAKSKKTTKKTVKKSEKTQYRCVSIYLSRSEYNTLSAKADAEFRTVSNYIRAKLFSGQSDEKESEPSK